MEKFVGVKLVEAEPMTALEASKKGYYRGNRASDGELNEMQGYHVHYTDNDYHSWSPKNVFENSYHEVKVEEKHFDELNLNGKVIDCSKLYEIVEKDNEIHVKFNNNTCFRVVKTYKTKEEHDNFINNIKLLLTTFISSLIK